MFTFLNNNENSAKAQKANAAAQAALFKSAAFEGSSVAMMTVDRDLKVTYINEATKQLLSENVEAFRKIWPSFNPDSIVGACIDMFHKDPSHQRQLLSDPSRLPYRTDITVGDFKFALNVTAVRNAQGEYVGNVLQWDNVTDARTIEGVIAALDRSQATIEFTLDGKILTANENFLNAVGYRLDEVIGQHHSIFLDPTDTAKPEYRAFWDKLSRGEFDAGKYRRKTKSGEDIWIQAAYNPILDKAGKPFKVVKFATDITDLEMKRLNDEGLITALNRAQAVIEFEMDGTITHANENFLNAVGYRLDEIVGKHHRIFIDPKEAASPEYRAFWDKLGRGEFDTDKYRRVTKSGEDIWIQAAYNPIFDNFGKPFKVVKFASDVTAIELERMRNEEERAHKAAEQAQVVNALATGLQGLSGGDLTVTINETFAAEYEKLRVDFNAAVEKLAEAMHAVVVNADGIRNNAREISQAADDLSRRTENQAATLEETAAAIEEMTSSIASTAEGAKKADGVVASAKENAQSSGAVVDKAIEAMSNIEESAGQISQIVGVIDDIAFQTNLLALNAGVEAARAGEAGRGFAVVASEVRALAQRSSDAAKEIKDLITQSSQHVSSGVEYVGQTGLALKDILASVVNISEVVSEIASAAQEQSMGLTEINSAVAQLDQVTQQNAAMVEESTAASHTLTNDAEELRRHVQRFRVSEDGPVAASSHSSPGANPVAAQQRKVADFAVTRGANALAIDPVANEDDWEDF